MDDQQKGGLRPTGDRPRTQQSAQDSTTVQTELQLRHPPIVHVSLYEPHPGRRTWWFAYRCGRCQYGHQGQLRNATDEDSAHKALRRRRHTCCGRRARFIVARVYRGQTSEVAA